MGKILARLLVSLPPTILGVLTGVFLITRLIPGDPSIVILGELATPESLEAMRHQLGLDQPILVQYVEFLYRVLQGDLGRSLLTDEPVVHEILRVFPFTLELAFAALFVSVILGIPVGIFSATRRNTPGDYITMAVALLGVCSPAFWVGILLILTFGLQLGWFPVIGAGTHDDLPELLHHLVLPAIALGTYVTGLTARITRSSILDVLGEDYIVAARSKGLVERIVVWRHVLWNALIPVVTVVGLNLGRMMGGSIIVEIVFARPGLGRLLVDAIFARDYPKVQAVVAVFALIFILVNFLVDLSYSYIDPRIEHGA